MDTGYYVTRGLRSIVRGIVEEVFYVLSFLMFWKKLSHRALSRRSDRKHELGALGTCCSRCCDDKERVRFHGLAVDIRTCATDVSDISR